MANSSLEWVRLFVRRHWWVRVLGAVLMTAALPLLMVVVVVVFLFGYPYDLITRWSRGEELR